MAELEDEVRTFEGGAQLPEVWAAECKEIADRLFCEGEELSGHSADRLNQSSGAVWEAGQWFAGDAAEAWRHSALLISGEPGRGKSHLLADSLTAALDREQPAVLLLGQQFVAGDPWEQIRTLLGWNGTVEQFLEALNDLAAARRCRALLMIDALNEGGGKDVWFARLASFLTRVARYRSIAVVLTVRSAAERACIPAAASDLLYQVEHEGFAGAEFDAVHAFFRHYGIAPF